MPHVRRPVALVLRIDVPRVRYVAVIAALVAHGHAGGWASPSRITPELMSAAILFGAFDPDDKVPDHPDPET
jgi:hypothetical protein